MPANRISERDYIKFDQLYNRHSSKIFGFLKKYCETKEEAEQYLEKVFLQVALDINLLDSNTEKRLLAIVLTICRPLFKVVRSKKYSMAL